MRRGLVALLVVATVGAFVPPASSATATSSYQHPPSVRVPSCKFRFHDGYSGRKFSRREVVWTIRCAVDRWPVSGGVVKALYIAERESGYRAWAENSTSSATGVYQIVSGTWRGMKSHLSEVFDRQQLSRSRWNARANVLAAIRTVHGGGWGPWGG